MADESKEPAPNQVTEGDFGTIKIQLAPGGTGKPQRPTRSAQLVWGGDGPSSPWGHIAAIIEAAGGQVSYTLLHAATLIRKRNGEEPGEDAQAGGEEGKAAGKEEPEKKKDAAPPPSGPLFEAGLDFEFQNHGHKDARVWAHPKAAGSGPRPLLVFLHGIKRPSDHPQLDDKMSAKYTCHLGKLAGKLIDDEKVTPLVIAAPTCRTDGGASSLWVDFNLAGFVAKVAGHGGDGGVEIDVEQISVAGHSGAGCAVDNGIYAIARKKASFDGHHLKVLGLADTCIGEGFAQAMKKSQSGNGETTLYSVHKGHGGGSTGVDAKVWAKALGATDEVTEYAGGESKDDLDLFHKDPSGAEPRLVLHIAGGDALWKHQAEFEAAGAMKKWEHGGWEQHYIVPLIWTFYALQRFHPHVSADDAIVVPRPKPKQDAPKEDSGVTGGEWANVPAPPAVWAPPDGAQPHSTGADFADPAGAIYWPVRSKSENGRIVCFIGEDGKQYGVPYKSGFATQDRQFLAKREKGKRFHAGVDVFGDFHDLVVACESGTILNFMAFYHGVWRLFVQCDSGLVINYGEIDKGSLSEFGLKPGDRIQAGQPIGRVGHMSGGGHMLHFETYPQGTKDNVQFRASDPKGKLGALFRDPTQYLLALARNGK